MRIILSFLLIVSGILVQAQDSQKGLLYLNKPLSAESINQVEARTSGGGIEVTGVNPSEARIEVYVIGEWASQFPLERRDSKNDHKRLRFFGNCIRQ